MLWVFDGFRGAKQSKGGLKHLVPPDFALVFVKMFCLIFLVYCSNLLRHLVEFFVVGSFWLRPSGYEVD